MRSEGTAPTFRTLKRNLLEKKNRNKVGKPKFATRYNTNT